ncbi:hypothetical protein CBP51_00685 [Cellvibrio mixtus]|uniref:Histidine kinase n=1 Tax=Cellvibrio mixtus TaxID=39650 RepID=A0A266Q6Y6_9GAMM|nr:FecR domain-containing protein [Cellvibrio mixtus]OZY85602.1 hypothetical protein CBP51_00685 [Cellvibrio mixtus]
MSSPVQNTSLPQAVITQAIAWRVRLEAGGNTSELEQAACQQWRNSDPLHALAWERLAQIETPFAQVASKAPGLAQATLRNADTERSRMSRRAALCALTGSTLGVFLLGWGINDTGVIQRLSADFATAVGERQQYRLADNSQLFLNTDSASSVNFNGSERRLSLARGELSVAVAADTRPFMVEAAQGLITSFGARLLVRQEVGSSLVQAIDGSLLVQPARAAEPLLMTAGQVVRLSTRNITPVDSHMFDYSAWIDGVFAVRNMPLKHLLAELGRYRRGVLRCAPDLENFQVSGVYQLRDTDLILRTLALATNADVRYFTRWWAEIVPQKVAWS